MIIKFVLKIKHKEKEKLIINISMIDLKVNKR